jgi:prohibitin 2
MCHHTYFYKFLFKKKKKTVEGGHRAIMFSRIGGVKSETYSEGLHLRVPWFQYPIVYDIR